MSSTDKVIDGNNKCTSLPSAYVTANSLDNVNDLNNTTNRPHSSHNSTISNESDLSLLSLSLDKEPGVNTKIIDLDELPAFEIRLISPLGRTPSPIDSEDIETPTRHVLSTEERLITNSCQNNPDYVALHDINAQISPPSDNGAEIGTSFSRTNSLETIYEGVFLNTPPRQRLSLKNKIHRSRTNLLEKVALNRLNVGKENQSPQSKTETEYSLHNTSLDFTYLKDPFAS